jgi:nitronate monooxygenase
MNALVRAAYPWVKTPIIVCAPMLRISLAPLAVAVSRAGGMGFLAGGFDQSDMEKNFRQARELIHQSSPPIPQKEGVLPVGIGFLNYGVKLEMALSVVKRYIPAAVWLYAPHKLSELETWAEQIRDVTDGKTKIWIQIGTAAEALEVARLCQPDMIVIQGSDSGGHGLKQSASVIVNIPEVGDSLAAAGFSHIPLIAAGGIAEGRGLAAALALGANGIVMGTRFLAAKEAQIAKGYQDDVLRAKDGGTSTARTETYDIVRGTTDWPPEYDARGIINATYFDDKRGMPIEENKKLYQEALKKGDEGWGPKGRITTYAGSAVGLVNEVLPAGEIVKKVAEDARKALERTSKVNFE